jgi:hypothetical protein
MHVKVSEGRCSNYRVHDCDWLIAGKSNVYSECEQTLGEASATNNVCAGGYYTAGYLVNCWLYSD